MTKISDNPDFQSLITNANSLEQIESILRVFNFGLDSNIKELREKAIGVATIADRFNDIFSEYGWIATEDMSVPLMEHAIKLFKENGLERAEKFICACFDEAYFSLHSRRMHAIWVWSEDRSRLLELAFIDHNQGRYHASVPVVLAQIDGLSFDTSKESFFDKKIPLIIKDSIAAHESGLRSLSKTASKPRAKTHSIMLSFPYRHGILHGRELAYDNKLVSTKCFFILFAMRPWALKCQQVEFNRQTGKENEQIVGFKAGDLLAEKIKEILEG
ncbi:MAG TPA: hypothetical protein DCP32_06515 [Anaerolineaceae bacterium]|nr:MAG: hypothetical protein A2X24_03535 [Chloroflexi bacterium GWB2_54_36]HAL16402.1 hypothetical protein [Anaerolineaceae bacterium]HBA92358.1 hypothetical protein [Anaerolineaceae bacterium]